MTNRSLFMLLFLLKGFTLLPAWICYSPCKNNTNDAAQSVRQGVPAGCAFTAESDHYAAPAQLLRLLGAQVETASPATFLGITAIPSPRLVFHPSFAVLPGEVRERFPAPSRVSISARSSLVVSGDVIIESLQLDGALFLSAVPGTRLYVRCATPIFNKVR